MAGGVVFPAEKEAYALDRGLGAVLGVIFNLILGSYLSSSGSKSTDAVADGSKLTQDGFGKPPDAPINPQMMPKTIVI
jgi:hypothetical protein